MPELFEVSFTAKMEDELDIIEQGKLDWKSMLNSFYEDFSKWVAYSYYNEDIDVGAIMNIMGGLSGEELEAYEAPYPDSRYKAGPQIFPYLIPSQLAKNERVWRPYGLLYQHDYEQKFYNRRQ